MPAGTFERTSPSSVAATPASLHSTPEKARTPSENRKSSKPIMEKRRRARINESLGQLKTLILDALKKDSSRHSKLEKADILEMTVKHLRNLQRLQMTAVNTNPGAMGKYRAGFSECVGEVTRFLSTCEGVNAEIRTRLLGHLATCVSQINVVNFTAQRQVPIYTSHPSPPGPGQASVQQVNGIPCKSGPVMNIFPEAVKLYGGLQVVPTTEGQFAFLIASTALAPMSLQNCHPALVSAMSPVVPPPVISDSVWRPW